MLWVYLHFCNGNLKCNWIINRLELGPARPLFYRNLSVTRLHFSLIPLVHIDWFQLRPWSHILSLERGRVAPIWMGHQDSTRAKSHFEQIQAFRILSKAPLLCLDISGIKRFNSECSLLWVIRIASINDQKSRAETHQNVSVVEGFYNSDSDRKGQIKVFENRWLPL